MKLAYRNAQNMRNGEPAPAMRFGSAALPLVACAAFLAFSGCASSNSVGYATKDPKVASGMLLDGKNKPDYEKFMLAKAIYKKEEAEEALRVLAGIERTDEFPDRALRELERTVEQYGNSAQKLRLDAWHALMVLKDGCTFKEEDICVLAIVRSGDAQIALRALRQVCRPSSREALEKIVKKGAKK